MQYTDISTHIPQSHQLRFIWHPYMEFGAFCLLSVSYHLQGQRDDINDRSPLQNEEGKKKKKASCSTFIIKEKRICI